MEELLFDTQANLVEKLAARIDEKHVDQMVKANNAEELLRYVERYRHAIQETKQAIYDVKRKEDNARFHFNSFMTDRQVLVDQLNLDVESKKSESLAQKKFLDEEFAKQKLRRIEALSQLKQRNEAEIDLLQRDKSDKDDELKKLSETKKQEIEVRRQIAQLKLNLQRQRQKNLDELPKIDLNRDTEKKKEREDLEMVLRNLESEKARKDEEKTAYEAFIRRRAEYEAQVKLQGEQLSKYRLENQRELQDFQKNEQSLIEYQTLTFKQSQKIKELKAEIEQLNARFPEEVARYTKEIEFLKFDNQNRRAELEYKHESLSDALRVRHKESKKLRQLLQLVLDQRSELEHFFIEELQTAAQKKERNLQAASGKPGGQARAGSKSDFSWEERQSVIEKVFAKVNAGSLPVYWREIDIEELRRAIVKEEEKKAQRQAGAIPDDSDVQRTIDQALQEED